MIMINMVRRLLLIQNRPIGVISQNKIKLRIIQQIIKENLILLYLMVTVVLQVDRQPKHKTLLIIKM